jgi:hypothetical protein
VTRGGSGGAADEADEDALAVEAAFGDDVGVARVFGVENGDAGAENEALEGGVGLVDEGGDDVAGAGLARFEDGEIAVADMGVDHRIAADAEGPELGGTVLRQAEKGGVDLHGLVGALLGGDGVAGGDAAVDGDGEELGLDETGAEAPGAAVDLLDGAFLREGAEMVHGGVLAGVAELALDVAGAGRHAAFALHGADEIENGFLFFAEHGRWYVFV